MVNGLLEQGVVRPIKSPYASPGFLFPKRDGGFSLVVDYRKVNAKVVFDSCSMPTIEQALSQFTWSLCVLGARPYLGLLLNKLPMGISVGSQGLSRVIDEFFADLTGGTFSTSLMI